MMTIAMMAMGRSMENLIGFIEFVPIALVQGWPRSADPGEVFRCRE
jgi:hypothetical protein